MSKDIPEGVELPIINSVIVDHRGFYIRAFDQIEKTFIGYRKNFMNKRKSFSRPVVLNDETFQLKRVKIKDQIMISLNNKIKEKTRNPISEKDISKNEGIMENNKTINNDKETEFQKIDDSFQNKSENKNSNKLIDINNSSSASLIFTVLFPNKISVNKNELNKQLLDYLNLISVENPSWAYHGYKVTTDLIFDSLNNVHHNFDIMYFGDNLIDVLTKFYDINYVMGKWKNSLITIQDIFRSVKEILIKTEKIDNIIEHVNEKNEIEMITGKHRIYDTHFSIIYNQYSFHSHDIISKFIKKYPVVNQYIKILQTLIAKLDTDKNDGFNSFLIFYLIYAFYLCEEKRSRKLKINYNVIKDESIIDFILKFLLFYGERFNYQKQKFYIHDNIIHVKERKKISGDFIFIKIKNDDIDIRKSDEEYKQIGNICNVFGKYKEYFREMYNIIMDFIINKNINIKKISIIDLLDLPIVPKEDLDI